MIRSSASASITVRFGGLRGSPLHRGGIELAIGLGARTAHGRALAAVQNPELDAALVGDAAHQAVERIDLADQMAFAEPADGRIAGHGADGGELMRDQRGSRAHAGRRGRGFTAGMAAADHDDVELRVHDRIGWRRCSRAGRAVKKPSAEKCFT